MSSARKRGGNSYRRSNSGEVDSEFEEKMIREKETETLKKLLCDQDIKDIPLAVIDFQIMYEDTLDRAYRPVEVGFLWLTLNSGIIHQMHYLINPGPPPLAYKYMAMDYSENYHKIPVDYDKRETDLKELWTQIESFSSKYDKFNFPRVFCLSYNRDKIESCLQFLHYKAVCPKPYGFNSIFCLEDLVKAISCVYSQVQFSYTDLQLTDSFMQTRWDFNCFLRCPFHNEVDSKFCSLSIVRTQSFILFEISSKLLKFELTLCHLPKENNSSYSFQEVETYKRNKRRPRSIGPRFSSSKSPSGVNEWANVTKPSLAVITDSDDESRMSVESATSNLTKCSTFPTMKPMWEPKYKPTGSSLDFNFIDSKSAEEKLKSEFGFTVSVCEPKMNELSKKTKSLFPVKNECKNKFEEDEMVSPISPTSKTMWEPRTHHPFAMKGFTHESINLTEARMEDAKLRPGFGDSVTNCVQEPHRLNIELDAHNRFNSSHEKIEIMNEPRNVSENFKIDELPGGAKVLKPLRVPTLAPKFTMSHAEMLNEKLMSLNNNKPAGLKLRSEVTESAVLQFPHAKADVASLKLNDKSNLIKFEVDMNCNNDGNKPKIGDFNQPIPNKQTMKVKPLKQPVQKLLLSNTEDKQGSKQEEIKEFVDTGLDNVYCFSDFEDVLLTDPRGKTKIAWKQHQENLKKGSGLPTEVLQFNTTCPVGLGRAKAIPREALSQLDRLDNLSHYTKATNLYTSASGPTKSVFS